MITSELYPNRFVCLGTRRWAVIFQHIDIAAAVIAALLIVSLALFFSKTKVGRALRAVADDVGILVCRYFTQPDLGHNLFAAGIVALVAGICGAQGLM